MSRTSINPQCYVCGVRHAPPVHEREEDDMTTSTPKTPAGGHSPAATHLDGGSESEAPTVPPAGLIDYYAREWVIDRLVEHRARERVIDQLAEWVIVVPVTFLGVTRTKRQALGRDMAAQLAGVVWRASEDARVGDEAHVCPSSRTPPLPPGPPNPPPSMPGRMVG